MSNNHTFIVYEGPSLIDQSPIVVLVQIGSKNPKTGDMVQTYILCADIDPITASRNGQDKGICGDCIHRGQAHNGDKGQALNRSCYVTLAHGPLGKWKAYRKGQYKHESGNSALAALGAGRMVRLGTYGDPFAVPNYIWESLLLDSAGHTAYTHGAFNPMPDKIMTSADNLAQAEKAWLKGERTFRVISDIASITKKEILCPASEEAGKRSTCKTCKLCAGSGVKAKSIAIVAHGTSKKAALSNINQSEGV